MQEPRHFEGIMAGLAGMFVTFLLLRLIMFGLTPDELQAQTGGIFWEEDWSGSASLVARGWNTDGCASNYPPGPWPEGCNPVRSTQLPFPGKSHSLREDYTGPLLEDGSGPSSPKGSAIFKYGFFSTRDLWIRWWQRTSPGFQYYAGSSTKLFYIAAGPGGEVPGVPGSSDIRPFVVANMFGNRFFHVLSQGELTNSPPCSGNEPGGPYNSCNYAPNLATINLQDNQWICGELHVKYGGNQAVNDGIIEMWIDGVKTHNYTGRNFGGSVAHLRPYWGIRIYVQSGTGLRYIGPFAVGNTRIGCGTTPPPVDTTPPAQPTSLAVPSVNLPTTLTWSYPGTLPGDFAGYKVYRALNNCATGGHTFHTQINGDTRTFTDNSVPAATTMVSYRVTSFDVSGNESSLAGSSCIEESLTPPGGDDTFAIVTAVATDVNGANLTFTGKAHKIRFWTGAPLYAEGFKTEITGLGGVSIYRHNLAWQTSDGGFVCYEAQGSNGIWQTQEQVCNIAPVASGPVTPPTPGVTLKRHPTNPIWLADSNNKAVGAAGVGIDGCCSVIPANISRAIPQFGSWSVPGFQGVQTYTFDGSGLGAGSGWAKYGDTNPVRRLNDTVRINEISTTTAIERVTRPAGLSNNMYHETYVTAIPSGGDGAVVIGVGFAEATTTRQGYRCTVTKNNIALIDRYNLDGSYTELKSTAHTLQASASTPYRCARYVYDGELWIQLWRGTTSIIAYRATDDSIKYETGGTCAIGFRITSGTINDLVVDNSTCGSLIITNDYVAGLQQQALRGSRTARFLIKHRSDSGSAANIALHAQGHTPLNEMPYQLVNTRIDTSTGTPVKVGIYNLTQKNEQFFTNLRLAVVAANAAGIRPWITLHEMWCASECQFESYANPLALSANNVNGIQGDTNGNGRCEECHKDSVTAVTNVQKQFQRWVDDAINDLEYEYEIANEPMDANHSATAIWENKLAQDLIDYMVGPKQRHLIVRSMWGPPVGTFPNWDHLNDPGVIGDIFAPGPPTGSQDWVNNPPVQNGAGKTCYVDMDHQGMTTPFAFMWKAFTRGCYPMYLDEPVLALDTPAIAEKTFVRMRQVNTYSDRVSLKDLTPVSGTSIVNSGYGLINACQEYLAYRPTSGTLSIDLTSCGSVTFVAEAMDASTGFITGLADVNGGAVRSFTPSVTGDGDFVIYLKLDSLTDNTPPDAPTGVTIR